MNGQPFIVMPWLEGQTLRECSAVGLGQPWTKRWIRA
jgi:hypothetical protein